MRLNYYNIVFIVVLSCIAGLVYNYFASNGIAYFYTAKQLDTASEVMVQDTATVGEPVMVTMEQARRLYDEKVTFIDARDPEDYEQGHIKGAVNLPYYGFEEFSSVLNEISEAEPIVIYCGGTDCDLSIMLGNKLYKMNYGRIYVFFGGWNEWLAAGYPTVMKEENNE